MINSSTSATRAVLDYAGRDLDVPSRPWTARDWCALAGLLCCLATSAYYVCEMHGLVPVYWREMNGDCGTGRMGVRMRWGDLQMVFALSLASLAVAGLRPLTWRIARVISIGTAVGFVLCELNRAGMI